MKNKGLTLVEILVVISVIAVLMSVVTPSLSHVKENAKQISCLSNQKQIGLCFEMYHQDHGTFPLGFKDSELFIGQPSDGTGDAVHNRQGTWWFEFIDNYANHKDSKKTIFRCPSRKVRDFYSQENILQGNYGVNLSICPDSQAAPDMRKPFSVTEIRRPAETFLISDSGYALLTWQNATESNRFNYPNPQMIPFMYIPGLSYNQKRETPEIQYEDALYGRHLKHRVNVLFSDLHVENRSSDSMTIEENNHYQNHKSLWLPF